MNGSPERIAGVILAGGASTRMGEEKSLLRLNGRTMIEYVIDAMRPVCGSLCIVANEGERFRFTGLRVIPDLIRNSGPLGGIHAALRTLDVPEILVAPCDTPLITPPLLHYLCSAPGGASGGAPARVARTEEGLHPLCGIYRREALPVIERCLFAGELKLTDALREMGASTVDITSALPFAHPDLFANVNDPEEFTRITTLRSV